MMIDAPLANARYELKFNARTSSYDSILNNINKDSLIFTRPYAPRVINNIYFDTFDLEAFQQNIAGASSRTKLRCRWYGNNFSPTEAALELKLKRNKYGWKLQDHISMVGSLLGMGYDALNGHFFSQVDKQLSLHLSLSPMATLLNSYRRDYFVSADSKVRVTVDSDLKFFDQRFSDCVSTNRSVLSPDMVVVEYKSAVHDLAALENAVRKVQLVRTRNSKYVIGISSALDY